MVEKVNNPETEPEVGELLALAFSNPNRKWWQFWKRKLILDYLPKPNEAVTMVEHGEWKADGSKKRYVTPVRGDGCLIINGEIQGAIGPAIDVDELEKVKH